MRKALTYVSAAGPANLAASGILAEMRGFVTRFQAGMTTKAGYAQPCGCSKTEFRYSLIFARPPRYKAATIRTGETSLFFPLRTIAIKDNGRKYTYDFGLDLATWDRARSARDAQLWKFHPRADYFLARGGTEIPPLYQCNIGLTNKCNLRCEICGAKNSGRHRRTPGRHMDRVTFEAVAETLFPVLVAVELNSQGDRLLHPDISLVLQRIKETPLYLKVQTNRNCLGQDKFRCWSSTMGPSCCHRCGGTKFDEVRRRQSENGGAGVREFW